MFDIQLKSFSFSKELIDLITKAVNAIQKFKTANYSNYWF